MSEAWTKTKESKEHKKWKPFCATDFDSLMYPCFFMAGVFGAFPYKRVPSGYEFSRIRFIYFTLMLIMFLCLLTTVEYKLISGKLLINTIPKIMYQHFYFASFMSIVVMTYIQSRATLHLLQAMANVSSMLVPKDYHDLGKFVHAKDIGMLLFLVSHLPNCVKCDSIMTLKNFTTLYAMLNIITLEMFYMNCVCVLKACFSKVNEDIHRLKKPASQKFLRNGQSTPTLLIKLKNFEEAHLAISDALQLLNKTFCTRLVITTCMTFTLVTFNVYFFILWRKGGERGTKYLSFWYLPYISSSIYYFFKFAMIIWACETATKQAVQIRTTLYDVLGEVSDMTMKREVELFSLQLLHLGNTFSARLINLNTSLLMQIVGGIAMYILILIQFLLNTVLCMLKNIAT